MSADVKDVNPWWQWFLLQDCFWVYQTATAPGLQQYWIQVPQFYTWDASSPTGCIFKKVWSQFLKLWALFFPSARILLMPSYFMLPFLTEPALQSTSCTHTELGGTATGPEPGRAETWAHITAGRATEVCSTGITLFPLCCRISKTNSMHFRAGSKVPIKRSVGPVLPGAWHPLKRTATKVKREIEEGGPPEIGKTKGNNEAFALEPENCMIKYFLKWADCKENRAWYPHSCMAGACRNLLPGHEQKEHWQIILE